MAISLQPTNSCLNMVTIAAALLTPLSLREVESIMMGNPKIAEVAVVARLGGVAVIGVCKWGNSRPFFQAVSKD